jgi:NAD(P)-dependent dehydrogenase (short-subunit alcohol dehydrogenase family)
MQSFQQMLPLGRIGILSHLDVKSFPPLGDLFCATYPVVHSPAKPATTQYSIRGTCLRSPLPLSYMAQLPSNIPACAKQLRGKASIIIGASRGIGAATAAAFAANGARVMLVARGVEAMDRIAQDLRERGGDVQFVRADAQDPGSIRRAIEFTVESFGRLDVAVNNAAINSDRSAFVDLADESFERIININLKAVFVAMKHEIKSMLAAGGGSIVNVSSAAGLVAMPMMSGYVASKHGVVGLTKAAALEYAKSNIRVNSVAPGAVMTEMARNGSLATEAGRLRVQAATPMGRIGSPEELAQAIVWLCSDSASFITGVTVPVDGGYTLT